MDLTNYTVVELFQLKIYLSEIRSQCEYALRVGAALNKAITEDHDCFLPLQYFVIHAALISKMLWPVHDNEPSVNAIAQKRGKALRALLGVAGGHPIKGRKLRNHLEHFDIRMDQWAQLTDPSNFIDRIVGDENTIAGIPLQQVFRHFDPYEGNYIFRGEKFSIKLIAEGVKDILAKTKSALSAVDKASRLASP